MRFLKWPSVVRHRVSLGVGVVSSIVWICLAWLVSPIKASVQWS